MLMSSREKFNQLTFGPSSAEQPKTHVCACKAMPVTRGAHSAMTPIVEANERGKESDTQRETGCRDGLTPAVHVGAFCKSFGRQRYELVWASVVNALRACLLREVYFGFGAGRLEDFLGASFKIFWPLSTYKSCSHLAQM